MAPKRAGVKAASKPRSNEEYLAAAFELDASDFLSYFEGQYPKLYHNYEHLCRSSDKLTEYHANPVVFILANEPLCCTHVARRFVDDQQPAATAPQATQASRSRSPRRPASSSDGAAAPPATGRGGIASLPAAGEYHFPGFLSRAEADALIKCLVGWRAA